MGEQPKQQQESEDRAALQIGDDVGEGGQRDILSDSAEAPDEEFSGMAKTDEQNPPNADKGTARQNA